MIDMNTGGLFVAFAISFGHKSFCYHSMRFLQRLWRFQLMMALKLHRLEFHHHMLWTLCILIHRQVGVIYLPQESISCVLIGRVHMAHLIYHLKDFMKEGFSGLLNVSFVRWFLSISSLPSALRISTEYNVFIFSLGNLMIL